AGVLDRCDTSLSCSDPAVSGSGTCVADPVANACTMATALTASVTVASVGAGYPSYFAGSCAASGGPEYVYSLVLAETSDVYLSTDDPSTNFDTMLYVRSNCTNSATELACNGDISGRSEEHTSELQSR